MGKNSIENTWSGRVRVVAMTKRVSEGFSDLDERTRAALIRWIEQMTNDLNIQGDRLVFEARINVQGHAVRISALREYQARLYGTEIDGVVPRTFLFTEIDIKKRQKADPDKLERAAKFALEHFGRKRSTSGKR